eukprot:CAMPEP_0206462238 /NCGR_PEP_ID=MMETSP0324_2-20121206/25864_1 /ASSEMBLY_ACC=CAM_ASM_000836 /TAXON_ID=2866 /ORGANISM="Crypthecodinium cohnii, Strain Seligo" /LENGTH=116 /DNA_ID=CAMNT_0053934365 /DNA_START=446 /DNA_END=796 /DNA_ORIENTATION=-
MQQKKRGKVACKVGFQVAPSSGQGVGRCACRRTRSTLASFLTAASLSKVNSPPVAGPYAAARGQEDEHGQDPGEADHPVAGGLPHISICTVRRDERIIQRGIVAAFGHSDAVAGGA